MNVLAHTAVPLLKNLVEPLNADLFIAAALDETRCPDEAMCSSFDKDAQRTRRRRSLAMLSARDLNQTHRLVGGTITGDGTDDEQKVRQQLLGQPLERLFGEWAVRS